MLWVFKGQDFHCVGGIQGSGSPLCWGYSRVRISIVLEVFKGQDFHCVRGIQGSGFPLC